VQFAFKRVALVVIIVLMPILINLTMDLWGWHSSRAIQRMTESELSMLIMMILGISTVITVKIVCIPRRSDQPPLMPEDQIPQDNNQGF